jgi:diguanylate cyclase (GGDEF)-like protein
MKTATRALSLTTPPAPPSVWRSFLAAFVPLTLLCASVVGAFGVTSMISERRHIADVERGIVMLQSALVGLSARSMVADLMVIAGHERVRGSLGPDSPERAVARDRLGEEFQDFGRAKPIYDQMRLLDALGREVVRVNQGPPVAVVSRAGLQDKGDRYYVQETLALHAHEVYVSPLDLNVEGGVVEVPHRPTLRIGTPVQGARDGAGALVLNVRAQHLLDDLRLVAGAERSQPLLVNTQGFWLLGPSEDDAFGAVLPDRADRRVDVRFADAWEAMSSRPEGQVWADAGLFTWKVIDIAELFCWESAPPAVAGCETGGRRWFLVSWLPRSVLDVKTSAIYAWAVALFVSGEGFLALVCLGWARGRYQQAVAAVALHEAATVDALTGVSTRGHWTELAVQEARRARRYDSPACLLMLDVDEFKHVNDTWGHGFGDQVLIEVARSLRASLRDCDLLGRLGGEEFGVLLPESDVDVGAQVAERLRAAVESCEIVAPTGERLTMTVSVGVAALGPEGDLDGLSGRADRALYSAKGAGRNRVVIAPS